jgi:O-acetyl-ADP-ribose deacetylase (regulator of RNase III)
MLVRIHGGILLRIHSAGFLQLREQDRHVVHVEAEAGRRYKAGLCHNGSVIGHRELGSAPKTRGMPRSLLI